MEIKVARREIEAAEAALSEALRLVEVMPKSQKVRISDAVELALSRLRAARDHLADLEEPADPSAGR